jgi:hypothetical protein
MSVVPDGFEFVVCLTHDVDRPFKRLHQSLYYGRHGDLRYHVESALDGRRPYVQFDGICQLEAELGVRSAFYFLQQPSPLDPTSPSTWLEPDRWIERLGRYDIRHPEIVDAILELQDGGWEVGLHGSLAAAGDPERLSYEALLVEDILGESLSGGRQHHLELSVPETWRYQQAAGLVYDSSLGSSDSVGFDHGHQPLWPLDDEFVVFPLTIMDVALPDPGEQSEAAWNACRRLLEEAREERAVMTVCWHPMYFNHREFPGYRSLYRSLIEYALELGAWVGPPREYYRRWLAPEQAATVSQDGRSQATEAATNRPIADDRSR